MKNNSASGFQNIIMCDDVREEIRNKKSIMGVIAGDIIPDEFPARLQIAFYMEYLNRDRANPDHIKLRILQDDREIAMAEVTQEGEAASVTTVILPRALIIFQKPCDLIIVASINNEPDVTILRKKILPARQRP